MSVTGVERFSNAFRQIRGSISGGSSGDPGEGGSEDRGSGAIESLSALSIADIMEINLATVSPDDTVRSAVKRMIEHQVSSIPVVDRDGRVVGALNEGDLMKVFYEPRKLERRLAELGFEGWARATESFFIYGCFGLEAP